MISVVEFSMEHVNSINPKDKKIGLQLLNGLRQVSQHPQVMTFTILENDRPIAIVGYTLVWESVAEVWSILDDSICQMPVAFARKMKRLLNHATDVMALKRLQMNVRASDPVSKRFVEFLGFKKEGLMSKYGPDLVDYYLYGRTA
jgi:RimJ/RimL family protein N-acetyltransferase